MWQLSEMFVELTVKREKASWEETEREKESEGGLSHTYTNTSVFTTCECVCCRWGVEVNLNVKQTSQLPNSRVSQLVSLVLVLVWECCCYCWISVFQEYILCKEA